jgi:putative copper export protein
MWEASYPFFEWNNGSWLGQTISGSIWYFPAIETVHILAMCIMFGALLVLNLRLLGLGMKKQSLPLLAQTLMPFVNWGLVIMLISGYMMFSSEALKAFSNDGFKF